jgi:hypothetical protein
MMSIVDYIKFQVESSAYEDLLKHFYDSAAELMQSLGIL